MKKSRTDKVLENGAEANPRQTGSRAAQEQLDSAFNPARQRNLNSMASPGVSSVVKESVEQPAGSSTQLSGQRPQLQQTSCGSDASLVVESAPEQPSAVSSEVKGEGGRQSFSNGDGGGVGEPSPEYSPTESEATDIDHVAHSTADSARVSQPQVFDLTLHDRTERFDISDSAGALELPQLSFMQAAELGEEGRRDIVEGAFPTMKRTRCQFDDSEGEDFGIHDDEFVQELDVPELGLAAVPHVAKATKRRIGFTTPASETSGFPLQPQVTKQEQRRLKGIEKEKARKAAIADNKAKARAKSSVLNDPSLVGEVAEVQAEEEVVDPFAPHPSHDLREIKSAAVTFCSSCSHWAWHNKHSKLAKPCEPLLRGNHTVLRLLQCDVVPVKGAKLPLHLRKRSWGPGQPK